MSLASAEMGGFQEILERQEAALAGALRERDHIAVERSADQMDEIQSASERDLAIQNVDRGSSLLREVKAALQRIHNGGFGICTECECAISPRRLVAVPWASRCIRCQDVGDRQERTEALREPPVDAAE